MNKYVESLERGETFQLLPLQRHLVEVKNNDLYSSLTLTFNSI